MNSDWLARFLSFINWKIPSIGIVPLCHCRYICGVDISILIELERLLWTVLWSFMHHLKLYLDKKQQKYFGGISDSNQFRLYNKKRMKSDVYEHDPNVVWNQIKMHLSVNAHISSLYFGIQKLNATKFAISYAVLFLNTLIFHHFPGLCDIHYIVNE